MVITSAGIEHDHLVKLANKHFGHLQSSALSSTNGIEELTKENVVTYNDLLLVDDRSDDQSKK